MESQLLESPSAIAGDLDAVLDRAAGVCLEGLDTSGLGDWLCRLQAFRARIDAACVAATVAAETAGVPLTESLFKVADYVAKHTNANPKRVGFDRTIGLFLTKFPDFTAAHLAGVLTLDHVRALKGVHNSRTSAALFESQELFITLARDAGWVEFTQALEYWKLACDPDGKEPAETTRQRKLILDRRDGMTHGQFDLDPIDGAVVEEALHREAERLRRDDLEHSHERTHTQRLADALVNLITRGNNTTSSSRPKALVHLVMSYQVLHDLLADHREPTVDPHDINARCELIDGTPIHPTHAAPLLIGAELRRLVLGANNEILDLGTATRCYPPHLKAAIIAAGRGRCATPGCNAPTRWLQADHITPAARGGPTSTRNAQPLCAQNNGFKSDTPPHPQRE